MRELERDSPATSTTPEAPVTPARLTIVGAGRAGGAIARAAQAAGVEVHLLGRGDDPALGHGGSPTVLLCVPDAAIAEACRRIAHSLRPGTAVGHVSGATTLEALGAAADAGCLTFSIHPLQTIPAADADLTGAPCAIAGSNAEALELARDLAAGLGMRPFEVPEEGRAAYHAAASLASNFLIALEETAAELLAKAGVSSPREILAPLVLRSAANWADGGASALTGPIARGDEETVARHLQALTELAPELTPLYQALAERARALSRAREDRR